MIEIKTITEMKKGYWLVNYTEPKACGCGILRKTITITQENKPSEIEIKNEIRNKR